MLVIVIIIIVVTMTIAIIVVQILPVVRKQQKIANIMTIRFFYAGKLWSPDICGGSRSRSSHKRVYRAILGFRHLGFAV